MINWEIVEPGLIRIQSTSVCVRHYADGHYAVEWRNIPVTGRNYYLNLENAKYDAIRHLKDMYDMGYEP
jgi:hypothetical protein